MKNQIKTNIKLVMLMLLLIMGVSYTKANSPWVGPTATAPGNNPDAPVNVGPSTQTKMGSLVIATTTDGIGFNVPNSFSWFNKIVVGNGIWSTGTLVASTSLYVVNGSLGVGTISPATKLEVVGGPIKATGGLIIQTCATGSCPGDAGQSSPANGQMWLVTN